MCCLLFRFRSLDCRSVSADALLNDIRLQTKYKIKKSRLNTHRHNQPKCHPGPPGCEWYAVAEVLSAGSRVAEQPSLLLPSVPVTQTQVAHTPQQGELFKQHHVRLIHPN